MVDAFFFQHARVLTYRREVYAAVPRWVGHRRIPAGDLRQLLVLLVRRVLRIHAWYESRLIHGLSLRHSKADRCPCRHLALVARPATTQ